LKWGTVGGRGKGNGEQSGGEVSIQSTRDLSGRESHHDAKEGFQVRREFRDGDRNFQAKGVIKRIGLCALISCKLVHIVLIVYMSC
jgi:hypothetical protein